MPAIFHAFEIAPHVARTPGAITGELGNLIPVVIVRINQNHRIMRRAAAQSAGPRIQHAVTF